MKRAGPGGGRTVAATATGAKETLVDLYERSKAIIERLGLPLGIEPPNDAHPDIHVWRLQPKGPSRILYADEHISNEDLENALVELAR